MAQAGSNYEKNWRSKISLDCPFKAFENPSSPDAFVEGPKKDSLSDMTQFSLNKSSDLDLMIDSVPMYCTVYCIVQSCKIF